MALGLKEVLLPQLPVCGWVIFAAYLERTDVMVLIMLLTERWLEMAKLIGILFEHILHVHCIRADADPALILLDHTHTGPPAAATAGSRCKLCILLTYGRNTRDHDTKLLKVCPEILLGWNRSYCHK